MARLTPWALIWFAAAGCATLVLGCDFAGYSPRMELPGNHPHGVASTYAGWIDEFSEPGLKDTALLIKTVAPYQGEFNYDYSTSSTIVSTSGSITEDEFPPSMYHVPYLDEVAKIAPTDFVRLKSLIANLPEDHRSLPPPDRRLLVQAFADGRTTVRVCDRANLSDQLLEILRLSQSRVRAWVPEFQPARDIEIDARNSGGCLALSPDQSEIAFGSRSGMQFWSPASGEYLGRARIADSCPCALVFGPDGSTAATDSQAGECRLLSATNWQTIRDYQEPYIGRSRQMYTEPFFTPDDKCLVLHFDHESLRFYDAHTGLPTTAPAGVPEDASDYFPATDGSRAVMRLKEGRLCLWDPTVGKAVSTLEAYCKSAHAAFSPDRSLVAAATASTELWWNPLMRIRIWNARTGELVQELRPFEKGDFRDAHGLIWSPDGQYLLCVTQTNDGGGAEEISLWNVRNGRHHGQFVGSSRINGIALMSDGSTLIAGCEDGHLRFWDFAAAMKSVRAFEASLR